MILQADIDSAKFRIVEVIDSRIPLKKRGETWWAACPFHAEKTASFAVSESKSRFKCFSCGVSGDTLDFLRRYHQTDFRGAVAILGIDNAVRAVPNAVEVARLERQHRRAEIKAEWEQMAAGLRYVSRLIAQTQPLMRESDWFTAELMLNARLDELEAQFRA